MATSHSVLQIARCLLELPRPLSRRAFSVSAPLAVRRRKRMQTYRRGPPSTPDPYLSSPNDPNPEDYWRGRMQTPNMNFYEQDEKMEGPRVLIDSVQSWDDVKRKRIEAQREHDENKALMSLLEQVWQGPSSSLPAEAQTRVRNRIQAVEQDPELKAEMRKLWVVRHGEKDRYRYDEYAERGEADLLPMSSTEPQPEYWDSEPGLVLASERVKTLNSMLKLAFLGANKFLAAQLWKAYVNTRRIPGVLEGIPDDAWDLIYWSQWAMKRGSERVLHLSVVQRDLDSVGMSGPPTRDVEPLRGEEEEEEDDDDKELSGMEKILKGMEGGQDGLSSGGNALAMPPDVSAGLSAMTGRRRTRKERAAGVRRGRMKDVAQSA